MAGSAHIASPNSATVVVTQSSNRAIINWSDFSINPGELTKFIQPSAASAILNRVIGSDPSALLGDLQSNGQVYLINPNGIVVGRGARIDAAGFAASTLDAADAQFLSGKDLSFAGRSGAAIANLGAIEASQGNVYLIAQQVTNAGSITAANGTVGLAAGTQVTLTQNGTDHVLLGAPGTSAGGGTGGAAVLNSGTIQAAQVELKAEGGNLYALAINNTGVVRATGVQNTGGRILLTADGTVDVSGTVDADAKAAGGQITVTGADVNIEPGALISANGGTHGGTVLIGGDRAGGSNPSLDLSLTPVANAEHTTVTAGARISANGANGSGGDVVVWSNDTTNFQGTISARGGEGTSGGFAEVSSHGVLNFTGTADLRAPNGLMGNLLLDPYNVTISNGVTGPGSIAGGIFTPTGNNSILNVATLATALDSSNVTVTTGAGGPQAGNITLGAPLTWVPPTGGSTLSLIAAGGVAFNAALTIPANGSLSVTSGTGAITQTAPITQVGAGTVSFNAGAAAITLTQNNDFTGAVSLSNSGANNVSLTNAAPTVLGTSSVGTGTLTVTSSGPITQTGTITQAAAAGIATFNAGANAISLTQNNDLTGTVVLTNSGANNVALTNAAPTVLGTSSVGTGTLTVTSGGPITQTGVFTQAAAAGAASFSAGANAITLTQANHFTGAVSLSNSGANNVALTNAVA
ncbi:MAG: filamentous hemagglutinin N-terminal domain-containing protein, partial [Steroidobacteraceae bacterium]